MGHLKSVVENTTSLVVKAGKCQHGKELGQCEVCLNPFYDEVWNLVFKKNRNVLIMVEGPPGTGKSFLGLEIARSLDSGFNEDTVAERVVFNPDEFVKILKSKSLYKGAVIMLEEFGIQDDHREWHSINNKIINYVFQSFRFMNLIVIINVPVADYVDSDARKLFLFHIETIDIDYDKNLCKCKIKKQSYNSMTKKVYRKFLRYRIKGVWLMFKFWKIRKPPVRMTNRYNILQEAYKLGLIDKFDQELTIRTKVSKEKNEKKMLVETDAVKFVVENKDKFVTMRGGIAHVNQQLIEVHFGVGRFIGARIKKMAEVEIMRVGERR